MTVVEFWVEQYNAVVAEKKTLGDKLRETLEENKDLQQKINRLEHSLTYTALKNMEANIENLQARLNNLRASNEAIRSMNSTLSRKLNSSMHQAQELKTQLKQKEDENAALHSLVDSFVDKCKELEDKAEGYKKERDEKIELLNAVQDIFTKADLEAQVKDLTARYENAMLSKRIYKDRLDKSIADRKELQADRDIWFRKNCEKQAEIEELKKKIQSLEADLTYKDYTIDTWRDRANQAKRELEEMEEIKQEFKQSYSDGYSDGNEEGQNELWEMLQLINDVKPFEAPYFEDVTSINDIISWDLEDFKEAYDKWEEEQKKVAEEAKKQHVEYMRDYLKRYCIGRLCTNCHLHDAFRPVTSCVFSKMTEEEVEKRYNKVIKSERELKKTPTPMSARLPQPWEVTIEGTVEINEDILKVVCGIKDDKK